MDRIEQAGSGMNALVKRFTDIVWPRWLMEVLTAGRETNLALPLA